MTEKTLHEARAILAGFFKQRREELNLSQADLAEKTGLGIATIKRMEDAKFWPGLKQYLIVCEALYLFPSVSEMEADEEIASALRESWKPAPKAMSIEEAIKMKEKRYNRDGQHN